MKKPKRQVALSNAIGKQFLAFFGLQNQSVRKLVVTFEVGQAVKLEVEQWGTYDPEGQYLPIEQHRFVLVSVEEESIPPGVINTDGEIEDTDLSHTLRHYTTDAELRARNINENK